MSRGKQIEEIDVMANDIAMTCPDLVNDGCGRRSCVECLANGMSDLGYRKASEVAREIFAEIEEVLNNLGYFDELDFNELKKKYTEGEG